MGKNVLIPLNILEQTVELLGYWDISKYDRVIRDSYDSVLGELSTKMKKLELRKAYTRIIHAKNKDAEHSARMEYLWQRNQVANECVRDYEA